MGLRDVGLYRPIKQRHVKSVSTTAIATPITRDKAAKEFTFASDQTCFVRFDTAATAGAVTACTSADDGNWSAFVIGGAGDKTVKIPDNCTFISVIALGSGTMYAFQA